MQLKKLLSDDRAVSPVIGVILMVAITVILAAVIGTFVLGLGDSVQQTNPSVSMTGDQNSQTWTPTTDDWSSPTLTISHDGGDNINEVNIDVTVNGNTAYGAENQETGDNVDIIRLWDGDESVSAGSSVRVAINDAGDEIEEQTETEATDEFTLGQALESGDTVRVIWTSDDGSSSSTLFSRDIN